MIQWAASKILHDSYHTIFVQPTETSQEPLKSNDPPTRLETETGQSEYAKWKNACKFECKVCSYSTKAYFTFNFHVKDKHGLLIQVLIAEFVLILPLVGS